MAHGSSLELLESRIAPAGVVKVTVTAGVLNLEGDAAANDVTVTETAPGMLAVTGAHGTQVSFEGATDTSASVTLPVSALTSDLGGGADALTLNKLTLAKVAVTDTAGSNVIDLINLRVSGDLTVLTGPGDDSITLSGSTLSAKSVTVNSGPGADQVVLSSIYIDLSKLANTGAGGGGVMSNGAAGTIDVSLVVDPGIASAPEFLAPVPVAFTTGTIDLQHDSSSVEGTIASLHPELSAKSKPTLTGGPSSTLRLPAVVVPETISLNIDGQLDALILAFGANHHGETHDLVGFTTATESGGRAGDVTIEATSAATLSLQSTAAHDHLIVELSDSGIVSLVGAAADILLDSGNHGLSIGGEHTEVVP